jgi:hypothetical protein
MQPGVLPPVSYRNVRGEQSLGAKLPGQRSLAHLGQPASREGSGRLPASRRSGARTLDRMLKTTEPLINAVNDNEPKMLTGSTQKGTWPGTGALHSPFAEHKATGGQAGAKRSIGTSAEHGKPVALPLWGRKAVRPTVALRVKEAGKSEGRAAAARIRGATSPGAKASRLPAGVSSREGLINRLRGQCR